MNTPIQTRQIEITGDCRDGIEVWQRFLAATNRLTGTTILSSIKHDFPGGGLTGLVLLAESHAAIHTWPEYGAAWVELATCGDPVALDEFERRMNDLLDKVDADGRP
jgi:S-adenosylmethionine/arginine decarboxylase-like enzyme